MNDPSVLLADEPTGNLDSRTSVEIMELLQRLNRERGITIVLITHEQDIAEYAERIVTFRDGRVVSDDAGPTRREAAARSSRRCPRSRSRPRPWSSATPSASPARAIRRNKVRSMLTMLGVIIGVASVIAMIALGSGRAPPSTSRSRARARTWSTVSAGSFGRGPGAVRGRARDR